MSYRIKMFLNLIQYFSVITLILGHGMVLDPVARASRWRFNPSAPINYDDNEYFCGGFNVLWQMNNGKCGICGDNYADPVPRSSELGGIYGDGEIVKEYHRNGGLTVAVFITANHWGYFIFDLCSLDKNYEKEECFSKNPLYLMTGERRFYMNSNLEGWYNTTLQLPANLKCEHCVFRWTYNTGNSYGICEDGSGAVGCGKQEWFRTCSDIKIV